MFHFFPKIAYILISSSSKKKVVKWLKFRVEIDPVILSPAILFSSAIKFLGKILLLKKSFRSLTDNEKDLKRRNARTLSTLMSIL